MCGIASGVYFPLFPLSLGLWFSTSAPEQWGGGRWLGWEYGTTAKHRRSDPQSVKKSPILEHRIRSKTANEKGNRISLMSECFTFFSSLVILSICREPLPAKTDETWHL